MSDRDCEHMVLTDDSAQREALKFLSASGMSRVRLALQQYADEERDMLRLRSVLPFESDLNDALEFLTANPFSVAELTDAIAAKGWPLPEK